MTDFSGSPPPAPTNTGQQVAGKLAPYRISNAALDIEIAAYAGKWEQSTIHGRDIHAALVELKQRRAAASP